MQRKVVGRYQLNAFRNMGLRKTWNFLDYSVLNFPVSPQRDSLNSVELPKAATKREHTEIEKSNEALLSCVEALNLDLPIGLQLIGQRFEEEKVMDGYKVIRASIQNFIP